MRGEEMNIYIIKRTTQLDYDEFNGAVVAAETEHEAIHTHPDKNYHWHNNAWVRKGDNEFILYDSSWVTPENVKATLIGVAASGVQKGVILTDFLHG